MNQHMSAVYLATSLVLAITPGPGVVYVIARTASQGRQAGLMSVAGVGLGNFANAAAASLGLAALLATSSTAFTVVKFAGAAYLVYLGMRALRGSGPTANPPAPDGLALATVFREGVLVAILNPKTTLFFAAFLPQFMEPSGATAFQGLVLAALFVGIALFTDAAYVLATSLAKARLDNHVMAHPLWRYVSAATYFCLGAFAALSGSQGTR